jgi:hypothetical protein
MPAQAPKRQPKSRYPARITPNQRPDFSTQVFTSRQILAIARTYLTALLTLSHLECSSSLLTCSRLRFPTHCSFAWASPFCVVFAPLLVAVPVDCKSDILALLCCHDMKRHIQGNEHKGHRTFGRRCGNLSASDG